MAQRVWGPVTLRAAAILDTSYEASDSQDVEAADAVSLLVVLTTGSLDSIELYIEGTQHGTDTTDANSVWGQYTDAAGALLSLSYTTDGIYRFQVPPDGGINADRKVRAQVKGTGTTTGSSVLVTAGYHVPR